MSDRFLKNSEVLRISKSLKMVENDFCNSQFPDQRYASAKLHLKHGTILESDFVNPRWTADELVCCPPRVNKITFKDGTMFQMQLCRSISLIRKLGITKVIFNHF